jgi:hypothetical protein
MRKGSWLRTVPARHIQAKKRGGAEAPPSLDTSSIGVEDQAQHRLRVDEALSSLQNRMSASQRLKEERNKRWID